MKTTAERLADHRAWLVDGMPDDDSRRLVERDANLINADLTGADLRYSDLRSADLRSADLRSARLNGAYLHGAYLHGARGITSAGPVGREGHMVYAVDRGDCVMVHAGFCWDAADAAITTIKRDYTDAPVMGDAYIATVRAMVATLEAQR